MSMTFQSLSEAGYRELPSCARCGYTPDHGGAGVPDDSPAPSVCPRCGLVAAPSDDGAQT